MLGGDPEYPAIWGALLILNWPVYAFVYRQIFLDRQDLKQCVRAALKPSLFWKWGSSEPWSAGVRYIFFSDHENIDFAYNQRVTKLAYISKSRLPTQV